MQIFRRSLFSHKLITAVAPLPHILPIIIDVRKEYESKAISTFIAGENIVDRNVNIAPIVYTRTEFKKAFSSGNDVAIELERVWRIRTLHQHTPTGGVIMYYDAFKEGFAYRCDTTAIPYSTLNAVAMKYVGVFKCRDLFVDTAPVFANKSPLVVEFMDELYAENKKKRDLVNKMANTIVTQSTSPFANFRTYNKTTGLVPTVTESVNAELRNRFIYAGRISGIAEKTKTVFREPKPIGYAAFKRRALV
jgi:hypothetical protein